MCPIGFYTHFCNAGGERQRKRIKILQVSCISMRCDALPAFHVAEIWDSSEIKNELCISVYLLVYSLYVYAYIYRCVYILDNQRRDFRSKYPYIIYTIYIVLL